ncbi:uncharacterized protein [Pleurodeles waltl]|uniref:uncharacterized protein isoform X3 n=1 Tax=Pleurodeles waltl TaxID=8319 RepID=UPI003709AD62
MTIAALKWCLTIAGITLCKAQAGNFSLTDVLPTKASESDSSLAAKNTTVSTLNASNENISTAASPTIPQPTNLSTSGIVQDPTDTHSPNLSHQSETSHLPQDGNAAAEETNKDSNDLNEIFTGEDELLNLKEATESPALENSVQEVDVTTLLLDHTKSQDNLLGGMEIDSFSEDPDSTGSNRKNASHGLESWKIIIISAAVFLVLEVIVLVIYCRVCRNRKKRTVIISKNCEQDSEAAETIHAESNENTLSGEDGTLNLVSIKDALEFPETNDADDRIDCLLSTNSLHPQPEETSAEI